MSEQNQSESKGIPDEFREATQYFEPMLGMRAMMRGKWYVLVPSCVDDSIVGLQEGSSHGLTRDKIEAYDFNNAATLGCMQAQLWMHPLLEHLKIMRDDDGAMIRVMLREELYSLTHDITDSTVTVFKDGLGYALLAMRKIIEEKAAKLAALKEAALLKSIMENTDG